MAGLLHRPVPGRVGGDAAQVHPASVVLDEYQHAQPVQQHGIDVKKIDGQDPGGLGVQELPPRRAIPARCGTGTRRAQDLIDSGRRDRHAQLGQLAMNAPVSPERVLFRQADGEPGDAADRRRAAGLAPVARVVPPGGEPAVPAQQCRGRHRKDPGPAPPRDEPRERGEPGPVGWLVPHPPRVPAQHRILVPENQQPGVLRLVPAEHQDSQAKSPAHEQVGDLEQHPASQPSPHHPFRRNGSSTMRSSFRAAQGRPAARSPRNCPPAKSTPTRNARCCGPAAAACRWSCGSSRTTPSTGSPATSTPTSGTTTNTAPSPARRSSAASPGPSPTPPTRSPSPSTSPARPASPAPCGSSSTRSATPRPASPATPGPSPTSSPAGLQHSTANASQLPESWAQKAVIPGSGTERR